MVEYHDLLSTEETNLLLVQAQSGNESAVNSIIRHNQRLVEMIANRYFVSGFGGDQDLNDLCQWGNIGLLRAIQKWDPTRGLRFSTYATHWINGVIRRNAAMRGNSLGMTHRETIKLSAIRQARNALTLALGREPAIEEIAEHTGLKIEYITKWMPALNYFIRLDRTIDQDNDTEVHELIPGNDEIPDDIAERSVTIVELCQKIAELPPRQREVITRRYLVDPPDTFNKIAESMNITYQRVVRIEHDALRDLRRRVDQINSPA